MSVCLYVGMPAFEPGIYLSQWIGHHYGGKHHGEFFYIYQIYVLTLEKSLNIGGKKYKTPKMDHFQSLYFACTSKPEG